MQSKEDDCTETLELIANKAQEVTGLRQAHMKEVYHFWHSVRAGQSVPSASWCQRQFDMYLLKIYGEGEFTPLGEDCDHRYVTVSQALVLRLPARTKFHIGG